MSRFGVKFIAVGVVVGAIVVSLVLLWPGAPRTRLIDAYVLFVAALLMFGLVQATRDAAARSEPLFDRLLRRRTQRPARPPSLAKLERAVALSAVTAFDFHARLRPTLREIAASKLAARGLVLDSGSPATREALGDDLWDLLRPDGRPPDDRSAPGLPLARLRNALDRLEQI